MSELTRDSALEFLADYIANNEINYVGGEFEREDNNERFFIVVSKESALKNLTEKNQHLNTDRQNAISLMSKSWQHDSENQDDLITRYVTMAENQFKKKSEEIERLTAIATKHATRCDELYEALDDALEELKRYEYTAGIMSYTKSRKKHLYLLDKSRTEADK